MSYAIEDILCLCIKSDNWLKHNVGYDKVFVAAAYLKYRNPCWNVDKTHDSDEW